MDRLLVVLGSKESVGPSLLLFSRDGINGMISDGIGQLGVNRIHPWLPREGKGLIDKSMVAYGRIYFKREIPDD